MTKNNLSVSPRNNNPYLKDDSASNLFKGFEILLRIKNST